MVLDHSVKKLVEVVLVDTSLLKMLDKERGRGRHLSFVYTLSGKPKLLFIFVFFLKFDGTLLNWTSLCIPCVPDLYHTRWWWENLVHKIHKLFISVIIDEINHGLIVVDPEHLVKKNINVVVIVVLLENSGVKANHF